MSKKAEPKKTAIETKEVVLMPEHVEVYYDEYNLDFGFRHWLPDKLDGVSGGFASREEAAEFAGMQLPGIPIEFSCVSR